MKKKVMGSPKIFYGWWIVIASSALSAYNGGVMFYGFTAFFTPIINEFGWSRAATSLAFSMQRLELGIAAPAVGYFIDKLGPRKMSLFGVTVFGLGFLFLSQTNSLLTFYIFLLIISVGHSSGFNAVGSTTVANWFVRKRGKAIGFLTGGVCFAGTVVPVLVWLINQYGWRRSLIIAGLGMWIIGIPLSFVFRQRPEQYGLLPDGDMPEEQGSVQETHLHRHPQQEDSASNKDDGKVELKSESLSNQAVVTEVAFTGRDAIRTRTFWFFCLGCSLPLMAMGGLFIHIMPFLESVGISRERASFVVTLIILLSVLGRTGFGWLSDYINKKYMLSIAIGLQLIGLLIFANIRTMWHVIPFLITFSPGYGASISLRPAIQGEYFGRKHFGTIQGFYMAVSTVSTMTGAPFVGWIWDITGSYRLAFLILTVFTLASIPFILSLSPPKHRVMI
ncbi:MFS transporter [Thermodesulfobacteriota bacterium]